MTREQLQDELYALVVAAGGARRWETALPARAADHAARREVARLNILAEFDRLYAIAYGPRVNPVNTVNTVTEAPTP